jgi:hypothetical protein
MNETKITNCEKNSFANTKKNNSKKKFKSKEFFYKTISTLLKNKMKKVK